MRMSDTITEIAAALAKAQGAMDDATKSETNPHFRSKYADLAAVREVIREPLAVNDLSIIQAPRSREGEVEVETMILHKSGEFIAETLSVPLTKRDAQGIGSAISYARRYGLMSLLGLAAADDDGNEAVRRQPPQPSQAPATDARRADSEQLLGVMKGSLGFCESYDSLASWIEKNGPTKARLLPEHADEITELVNDKKRQYPKPKQPPMAAE
jgi:hypothetical protein